MGEEQEGDGRLMQLGAAGQSSGAANLGSVLSHAKNEVRARYSGAPTTGMDYIAYIEGDPVVDVQPTMAIQDFASRNRGNYNVVVLRLH